MKEIKLTRGYSTIVDDEDFMKLNKHKWYASKLKSQTVYAVRSIKVDGRQTVIFLHRHLMNLVDTGMVIDHKNGNGVDNRKDNLRICTTKQNGYNTRKSSRPLSSIYKGVSRKRKGWRAMIGINRKQMYLGTFNSEIDAAIAYNEKAKFLFGEFASVNAV